jgi:glutaredoxin
LRALSGKETTPQIFIGGQYIGGSEELTVYLEK